MDYEIMMNGSVRLGQLAPEFEANTTIGRIKLTDYLGKWVVLFSHEGDFNQISTKEYANFAKCSTYFDELNTCLIRVEY